MLLCSTKFIFQKLYAHINKHKQFIFKNFFRYAFWQDSSLFYNIEKFILFFFKKGLSFFAKCVIIYVYFSSSIFIKKSSQGINRMFPDCFFTYINPKIFLFGNFFLFALQTSTLSYARFYILCSEVTSGLNA